MNVYVPINNIGYVVVGDVRRCTKLWPDFQKGPQILIKHFHLITCHSAISYRKSIIFAILIPNFIHFLYKMVEWRAIEAKFLIKIMGKCPYLKTRFKNLCSCRDAWISILFCSIVNFCLHLMTLLTWVPILWHTCFCVYLANITLVTRVFDKLIWCTIGPKNILFAPHSLGQMAQLIMITNSL